MNDFQRVAVFQRHVGQRRAWHDQAVAFDRDLLDVEAQRGGQAGGAALAPPPPLAVEDHRNHRAPALLCLLSSSPYRGSALRSNRKPSSCPTSRPSLSSPAPISTCSARASRKFTAMTR